MTTASLWQPLTVGRLELPHRRALSPMTRNRANSDIVERLRNDEPFNDIDPATLYTGGATGYVDYPSFARA